MLEARELSFAHAGREPLFEKLDLQVDRGERVAIKAPSGWGKTSLCRVLAGYAPPTSGQVLVDGKPLPERGICPVQLIGQHPELAVDGRLRMQRTLDEALGARGLKDPAACAERDELLAAFGIRSKWLRRFPHELSGGELQRFCIVRALMAKPAYLIADEITTMLDAYTQAQVWQALIDWQASSDAGMLLVTHGDALRQRVATRSVELA